MALGIVQTMLRKLQENKVLTLNIALSNSLVLQAEAGDGQTLVEEIELPPKSAMVDPAQAAERRNK